ncbi:hypothetical protein M8C21_010156, partial [Ambrosia artemisiifolia]
WEGRWNNGMSNSVTIAFCASVRGMAIGKTIATEKSDRATVEQDSMVLFKMLNRGIFHDINGCISTGKEDWIGTQNVVHVDGGLIELYRSKHVPEDQRMIVRRVLVRMAETGSLIGKHILEKTTNTIVIGSMFEYVNQRPVFGLLNSDSIFYAPVLGFFAFTGVPTAALPYILLFIIGKICCVMWEYGQCM